MSSLKGSCLINCVKKRLLIYIHDVNYDSRVEICVIIVSYRELESTRRLAMNLVLMAELIDFFYPVFANIIISCFIEDSVWSLCGWVSKTSMELSKFHLSEIVRSSFVFI